jgi:cell division protein FtsI (penicillin-binding protein 3)
LDPRAEALAVKRLRIFARGCLLWGLIVLARLFYLQIFTHDEYKRLAERQQDRNVELGAPRGVIFDRNGQRLAMSVRVDSVVVNPQRIPDAALAADLLARVLSLDAKRLHQRIVSAAQADRGFLWVKRKISPDESEKLRSYDLDWVEFREESSRLYPKGQLAAHILGGVDFEEKGNAGIELALNKELQGKPGSMRTTADVRQKVFEREVYTSARPGRDVTLTVDERIQYAAERELAAAVKEHRAWSGSLVVMNPKTGDLLAVANYPTYDPNIAPKPGEDTSNRMNLAVTAPFEPGSVFKVVTIGAALETTRLRPTSLFHCGNGRMTLYRRVIHDAKPHGMLSVREILEKSSNIGAIKVALEVGDRKMYEYVRRFGFGSQTGVLLPGESAGVVRNPERWIKSSIGSVAMGHELSTTTVQLAQACSAVANGGLLVRPRILLKREADENPARILKPETAIKLRAMMEGVVLEGTGRRARLNGYSSGGKTGSAQIYDYKSKMYTRRYNASFMGFAPVTDPAIVVVVTLNGTQSGSRGFGGVVAAPVFKNVAEAALRLLDVPKDLPDAPLEPDMDAVPDNDLAIAELTEPNPPQRDETDATPLPAIFDPAEMTAAGSPIGPTVPDFQGKTKRQVAEESSALGFRVELAGAGVARMQQPPPGAVLEPGQRVKVHFAR